MGPGPRTTGPGASALEGERPLGATADGPRRGILVVGVDGAAGREHDGVALVVGVEQVRGEVVAGIGTLSA